MTFMKTKIFLLALSGLFLLSLTSNAQPPNFAEMQRNPAMQQIMKNQMKMGLRAFWDGNGGNLMALGLMMDPELRDAWGVSDEQYQDIQGIPTRMGAELRTNPDFTKLVEEMQEIGVPGALFGGEQLDEATQQKLQEVQGKMTALSMKMMTESIDKAITPEQKQKMNESLLANMADMPMVSPGMFEALDLTDAQRQQMVAIKKELEPEFEKNLETFADGTVFLSGKMFAEIEKQGVNFGNFAQGEGSMQDRIKAMQEKMLPIQKKLMEDPEYKRISEDINTKGKAFATQFNTKMFDILTDEQWARLQKLIDNPPEHAKVFGKKMKEQQQAQSGQGGGWQPNANSWKPGDAIPEQYRQERNTRGNFPRGNN